MRFVGHNGDQNGFRAYLSLCPDQGVGSLLAFIALTAGTICEALGKPARQGN